MEGLQQTVAWLNAVLSDYVLIGCGVIFSIRGSPGISRPCISDCEKRYGELGELARGFRELIRRKRRKRRTRQTWLGTSEPGFPRKAPEGRWNPARGEAPGIDSNT